MFEDIFYQSQQQKFMKEWWNDGEEISNPEYLYLKHWKSGSPQTVQGSISALNQWIMLSQETHAL